MTSVAIVIPLYNDVDTIAACLKSALDQACESATIEAILVADGGSTDGSRAVVESLARRDPRVALVENPGRHVSTGLNLLIGASDADVVVRLDAHTTIAPDYVETAVQVLAETGADVAGGPLRPYGTTPTGQAVAWALNSRWGTGGSRFHQTGHRGRVDAVYMGVFPARTFHEHGMYDERFVRNQDDELTYRIAEQGGLVFLEPRLVSSYLTRQTMTGLWRQFLGYGQYKPLVLATHPNGARLRHFMPALAVGSWVAALLFAKRRPLIGIAPVVHASSIFLAAKPFQAGRGRRWAAIMTMHLAYGSGFIAGVGRALRVTPTTNTPGYRDTTCHTAQAPMTIDAG